MKFRRYITRPKLYGGHQTVSRHLRDKKCTIACEKCNYSARVFWWSFMNPKFFNLSYSCPTHGREFMVNVGNAVELPKNAKKRKKMIALFKTLKKK